MQDINLIYEKYSEIVYKYIFCLTGDKDTAEEIVQETFLLAVKDIKNIGDSIQEMPGIAQIVTYINANPYELYLQNK